eukprot:2104891-Pleurochrysis_carterae.AAC.1
MRRASATVNAHAPTNTPAHSLGPQALERRSQTRPDAYVCVHVRACAHADVRVRVRVRVCALLRQPHVLAPPLPVVLRPDEEEQPARKRHRTAHE